MSAGMSTIFVLALVLSQIFYQINCIKDLIIPTHKRNIELIFVTIGIIVILGIVYFNANEWIHYVIGVLASVMIGLNLYKSGITSKGFSFPAGYTGGLVSHVAWNKIKSVQISQEEHVKVFFYVIPAISAFSYEVTLYFKKHEYEKVISILKQNLPLGVIKIK